MWLALALCCFSVFFFCLFLLLSILVTKKKIIKLIRCLFQRHRTSLDSIKFVALNIMFAVLRDEMWKSIITSTSIICVRSLNLVLSILCTWRFSFCSVVSLYIAFLFDFACSSTNPTANI